MNISAPHLDQIWQNTLNWLPNEQQKELFAQLYQEILATNQYLNLTRITTVEEFWEKNLWDSLAPVIHLNFSDKKVIDIGTGGGFPGVVGAIIFNDAEFCLIDSTTKKINFINELAIQLNLKNIITLVERAENIGQNKQYRNNFDYALIRAVAETSVCLEYTLPLLKKDGIAVLYRGNWNVEEENKAQKVAHLLGGKIIEVINKNTPLNNYTRHNIYVQKVAKTSKEYPRPVGKPVKYPLG
ncbi:MAG: 16S rRNA (guanine(527)-N(7))-methyltransferase RsmG [Cyanobacterium sp. T60_A2020_053]|nr:16S rRNA (guanine(527)-N(7))-methyltransferase RsmG [Cyanobacterium sp. T60_A2020_053]